MKLNIETIMPGADSRDRTIIIKVDLNGSLDNNNANEFEYIMSTFINGGAKKIIIDFNDLQNLDSTGVGLLITLTKKIRKERGEIIVTRNTTRILTALKPLNIEKFIQFFPDVEDGVNYLRSV
jgi:anti-anti-sigma factor